MFWWLDRYADFDDAQKTRARAGIAQWFAWHRRTQLPDYAQLLARMEQEITADTTPQRLCTWWGDLRGRADLALAQAMPAIAELAPTLSPAQLQHIRQRQDKSNENFRDDYLQPDPDKRLAAAVKRVTEHAERIYGSLDDAQHKLLKQWTAASPFDPQRWNAERLQRQRDAVALIQALRSETADQNPAQALTALRAYGHGLLVSPREDYRRYADQLERYNCAFAAAVHNSTSAAQRKAAQARLKGWEEDLRVLAAQAP